MADQVKHYNEDFVTPYGVVLGSFQGVEARSNGNFDYYSREQNYHNGLYTGIPFQCVEYVRRWLNISKGLTFYNIPFASHAWQLKYIERLSDSRATSIVGIPNGSEKAPVPESLLIWDNDEKDEQIPYGHIAVITEVNVQENWIRVAEQNIDNNYWPGNYARQLALEVVEGKYFIKDQHKILGWMVINFDVDSQNQLELGIHEPVVRKVQPPKVLSGPWLNFDSPGQKYWANIWGAQPTREGEEFISYYTFDNHFYDRIMFAAMELNHMCLTATDYVINNDSQLEKFGLPKWTWDKIRNSWKGEMISGFKSFSGRFDLAFNGSSIKMFEYNSDSAGTYLEAGVIQVQWAKAVGCDYGKSASEDLENMLIEQAKELFKGFVHILIDNDDEEVYNALYIKEVFEKAGVDCKVVIGVNFKKNDEGKYTDEDGVEMKTIWKMWNWETVISNYESERKGDEIKLSDVLLDENIDIYEPIWKLVTSNKALLAVLWEMFPGHPYLLPTEWTVDGYLRNKPYVKKPIVGRCGQNVQIYTSTGEKVEEMEGRYTKRDCIYQEVFEIQKFDGFNPILGAWIVGMKPAGFGIREDTKLITDHESPYGCCRVINI